MNEEKEQKNSLNVHCIYAIWNEDATEVLEFHLDEREARQAAERHRQSSGEGETFHLAAYELKASSTN